MPGLCSNQASAYRQVAVLVPDDWVRVVDTAHEPRRSHWILKNHLEGHAQLAPGVYYVINLGSGRFLDGAPTIHRLNALHTSKCFAQATKRLADSPFPASKSGVTGGR